MEIKAEKRTLKGKANASRLRKANYVPAVLYGHKEDPVALQLSAKEVSRLNAGEHLKVDFGEKADTIIKEIQRNPLTSDIIHIDFQKLRKGEKVRVNVQISIEGIQDIIKKGGILEHKLSEIEIECLPDDIPDSLKIDVSNLNIGDSLQVKDLPKTKGNLIEKPDTMILSIIAPRKEEVKPAEETIPTEEQKDGEVTPKKEGETTPVETPTTAPKQKGKRDKTG